MFRDIKQNNKPVAVGSELDQLVVNGLMPEAESLNIFLGELSTNAQPVIIKSFDPDYGTAEYDLTDRDDWSPRIRNEMALLRCAYPVAPKVLDLALGKYPYIVMERTSDISLKNLIDKQRSGKIPTFQDSEILQVAYSVAVTLNFIHVDTQTIHGDVKPHNILVSLDNFESKLLDFGSAYSKQYGVSYSHSLTYKYASPARLKDEFLTIQDDIYSLGLTIYELAARGEPLFYASSPKELLREKESGNADFNARVSEPMKELISKMVGINGHSRISDYAELFTLFKDMAQRLNASLV